MYPYSMYFDPNKLHRKQGLYICIHIYIYICIKRETERERWVVESQHVPCSKVSMTMTSLKD